VVDWAGEARAIAARCQSDAGGVLRNPSNSRPQPLEGNYCHVASHTRCPTRRRAIPWPDGLAPRGAPYDRAADHPLPSCDVVVVTWTVAEAQALADVRYGYWTSLGSAIATWAALANLN
jgi:hypothetical protein